MDTTPHTAYPLTAQSRITIGLQILNCVLLPLVPETLKQAGVDPLSHLPPSSPVLKHGFDLDARAALRLMSNQKHLFSSEPDRLMSLIKPLSRLRDRWAHQQELTQSDASAFLLTASELCQYLDFEPEARACQDLSKPAPQSFDVSWLAENWETDRANSITELEKYLFEQAELSDITGLHKLLVWTAADDWIRGRLLSTFFVLDDHSTDDPEEIGLPIRSLWWLFDLSHKTPVEIRRAAYLDRSNSLDPFSHDF